MRHTGQHNMPEEGNLLARFTNKVGNNLRMFLVGCVGVLLGLNGLYVALSSSNSNLRDYALGFGPLIVGMVAFVVWWNISDSRRGRGY